MGLTENVDIPNITINKVTLPDKKEEDYNYHIVQRISSILKNKSGLTDPDRESGDNTMKLFLQYILIKDKDNYILNNPLSVAIKKTSKKRKNYLKPIPEEIKEKLMPTLSQLHILLDAISDNKPAKELLHVKMCSSLGITDKDNLSPLLDVDKDKETSIEETDFSGNKYLSVLNNGSMIVFGGIKEKNEHSPLSLFNKETQRLTLVSSKNNRSATQSFISGLEKYSNNLNHIASEKVEKLIGEGDFSFLSIQFAATTKQATILQQGGSIGIICFDKKGNIKEVKKIKHTKDLFTGEIKKNNLERSHIIYEQGDKFLLVGGWFYEQLKKHPRLLKDLRKNPSSPFELSSILYDFYKKEQEKRGVEKTAIGVLPILSLFDTSKMK